MILAFVLCVQADFAERKLGEIPDTARLGEVVITPDGKIAGYSINDGKKSYIVRGDWRTKDYDVTYPIGISADGLRLLYMTIDEREGNHLRMDDHVVQSFDARKGETWRSIGALTPDGKVSVFTVGHQTERWWTYSINGKNGTPHPLTYLGPPQLSLDGKVIAGHGNTPDESHQRVVVNDVAGPVYDEVTGPAVSENGVVAYVGDKDGTISLHYGDKVSRLDGPMPNFIFVSADGTKLGYVLADKAQFVKVGAKTYPKLKRIWWAAFDPRGERVVYWGLGPTDKPFVGVDGRLFEAPGIKTPPVFSPDGGKVGYAAEVGRELRWKVVDLSK